MSLIQFGRIYKKIAPVQFGLPYEYLIPIEFTLDTGVRCLVFDKERDFFTCTKGELLYYYTVSE